MSKYRVTTLNEIAEAGLEKLGDNYEIVGGDLQGANAIILRSASLHDTELPDSLHCIARAGAGVNNIPTALCAEKGIVVFNTPGANSNAVKELAVAALLLSSRKIVEGINWTRSLSGDDVSKQVEKGKSQFAGPELSHKKIGVIGLGAIGVMVANIAVSMNMEVYGYDPYLSVEHAWGLSRSVKKAGDLKNIFKRCDYISMHVPLTDETKNMMNKDTFNEMKDGVRIINLSRSELVNNDDIIAALESGKVGAYVTDFPDSKLVSVEGVIPIPHLGASTPESETNCAVMAAVQTKDFLENGNIRNSVNYPTCDMGVSVVRHRLTVAHKNIPKMLGQISAVLSEQGSNIANMINRSRGEFAYTMVDVEEEVTSENVKRIKEIPGVLKVRVI